MYLIRINNQHNIKSNKIDTWGLSYQTKKRSNLQLMIIAALLSFYWIRNFICIMQLSELPLRMNTSFIVLNIKLKVLYKDNKGGFVSVTV